MFDSETISVIVRANSCKGRPARTATKGTVQQSLLRRASGCGVIWRENSMSPECELLAPRETSRGAPLRRTDEAFVPTRVHMAHATLSHWTGVDGVLCMWSSPRYVSILRRLFRSLKD